MKCIDKNGNELKVGDRVMFGNKKLMGYGKMATIICFEKDKDLGWAIWVRRDDGAETGEFYEHNGFVTWELKARQKTLF